MKRILSVILAVVLLLTAGFKVPAEAADGEKGYIHVFYMDKSGKLQIVWKLEVTKDETVTVPASKMKNYDPAGKLDDIDDLKNITGIIAIIYDEKRDGDSAPTDLKKFYSSLSKTDTYQTTNKDRALWLYEDPAGGSSLSGSLNIEAGVAKVKKIQIKNAPGSLAAGKSVTLKAVVSPAKATYTEVKWKSSNTKYATVNKKGKVKALPGGKGKTVKITAVATDGSGTKKTVKIKIS